MRVSAVPERLEVVEAEITPLLEVVAGDTAPYSAARSAFLAADNDLGGPAVADLSRGVDEVGTEWQSFALALTALAEALRAADADGARSTGAVTVSGRDATSVMARVAARMDKPFASPEEVDAHAELIQRAWDGDPAAREQVGKMGDYSGSALLAVLSRGKGHVSLLANLSRRVVHGARWAHAMHRVVGYRRQWYAPPRFAGSVEATRAAQVASRRPLITPFRTAHTERLAAKTGFWTNRPLTGVGQRLAANPVLKYGGKALGVAGVAFGAYDTMRNLQEGDTEGAIVSGVSTAGGAMMLTPFPPVQLAGLAITTGALIYSNWDDIAEASDWVGEQVSGAVDDVAEAGGEALDAIGDGLSDAGDAIGGLFD